MSTKPRKVPVKKRNTAIAKRARAKSAATLGSAATSKVEAATKPAKTAKAGKDTKPSKRLKPIPASAPAAAKRPRVRVTFAIPEVDYARIASLKAQAKRAGFKVRKSELVRLGLRSLQQLDETELQARVVALRASDDAIADA